MVFVWQKPPSCPISESESNFKFLPIMQAVQRCALTSGHRLHSRKRFFYTSSRLKADPWLLPNTPEHLKSTTTPPDLPPPTPLIRLNESIDTLRARLLYQSRKRGTLESDLLLSTFARDYLSEMSDADMREYDKVSMLGRFMVMFFLTTPSVIG
jgi:succinate dehydrogenase assembly factor 2